MLKIDQQAPLDIQVFDEHGQAISLKDALGKFVVLYFYPKDDTPGCTKEACSFRDANRELTKLGVRVIGVSKDTWQSHAKFKEKYHLNFELWSDPDRNLLSAFGAWGQKKTFGKIYMGILRSTFLIDPKGKIVKVWPAVKPEGHAQAVLETYSSGTFS